jgi:hypothetical protein
MEGIESLDQFLVTTFCRLVHPDLFRSRGGGNQHTEHTFGCQGSQRA